MDVFRLREVAYHELLLLVRMKTELEDESRAWADYRCQKADSSFLVYALFFVLPIYAGT